MTNYDQIRRVQTRVDGAVGLAAVGVVRARVATESEPAYGRRAVARPDPGGDSEADIYGERNVRETAAGSPIRNFGSASNYLPKLVSL